MLKRLNLLEKQYGGGIPFSSLKSKSKKKTKKPSRKQKIHKTHKTHKPKKTLKKKKGSISPGRAHRKVTKKTKRSKKNTIQKKSKKCGCGSHKYTGKEETPSGLGKCSECIPLNVVMKGKDNHLYENTSSGWVRIN